MKKLALITILAAASSQAWATGDYLEAFLKHYTVAEGSAVGTASCAVCHVSDSDYGFNPYGEGIVAQKEKLGATTVDAAVLTALEQEDSDKDGTKDGDEIKADTLPGDPTSGAAPGVTVEPPKPKGPEPFPPKNGFHPAIVHFPIALFIGGLVLDFLGLLKSDQTLLRAGWYNLIMGAVTAFGGIMSGALAMFLMKMPMTGILFQHFITALSSTAIMWIMVFMRIHRHEKMNLVARVVYYILAAAALLIISWAGHLGGEMVYGG